MTTNQQLIEHIESMTMTGAGASDPSARFGYDRARGEILNLLRERADWPTAGNTDYELHGRPKPPSPPVDTEINVHYSGWSPKPLSEHVPGALNLNPPRRSRSW